MKRKYLSLRCVFCRNMHTITDCTFFDFPNINSSDVLTIYGNHFAEYNIAGCSHAFNFYKESTLVKKDMAYQSTAVVGERVLEAKTPDTPSSYTVKYNWDGDVPGSTALPEDSNTYGTEAEAIAAKNAVYTDGYTMTDGLDVYNFTGGTASTSGSVVTFTGT